MSKIIDSWVCWDGGHMTPALAWTVANILGKGQAKSLGLASAAVVNGQRLTAKQLAKFNKARLDKATKR